MTTAHQPRVSIGLPVYNGEDFLREAIESLLAQSFTDFELIISDNASTDGTAEICREYKARDPRVRYYRNEKNLGASANYTRVFELASGEYFKWAAHDDVCCPTFLEKCIHVLERDPSVVLCYPQAIKIDAHGNRLSSSTSITDLDLPRPHARFCEVLKSQNAALLIWGLMRISDVGKTRLLGNYACHDLPFLSGLSLLGRFYQIPEVLFMMREHGGRSIRVYDYRKPHQAIAWFDPNRVGKLTFPAWRLLVEHLHGIYRAPLSIAERLRCHLELACWAKYHKKQLLRDLGVAGAHIPFFGAVGAKAHKRYVGTRWKRQSKRAAADVQPHIPAGENIIMVDEGTVDPQPFSAWRAVPFLERDGQFWGLPTDDATAIRELERLRDERGISFLVFLWPSFWWLDYYEGIRDYLDSRFTCVLRTARVVIFDLR